MVFGKKKKRPEAPAPAPVPPAPSTAAGASTGAPPRRTGQSPAMDGAKWLGRESDRAVMRGRRDMQRERARLEAEERRIMVEIKALGKQGRMTEARMLAKNLVQVRNAKARTIQANSQMAAIGNQAKMAQANEKMMGVMKATTEVMQNAGSIMDPQHQQNVVMQYDMETEKYKLNQEMTDEVFDSLLGGEEIDAGTDQVLNSVLDEIGLEVASSTADQTPVIRPRPEQQSVADTASTAGEEDLMNRIARLASQGGA